MHAAIESTMRENASKSVLLLLVVHPFPPIAVKGRGRDCCVEVSREVSECPPP